MFLLTKVIDGSSSVKTTAGVFSIVGCGRCSLFKKQLQMPFGGYIGQECKLVNKYFLNAHNAKNPEMGIQFISELSWHLRSTVRVVQLSEISRALKIEFKIASPITLDSGYVAGFFIANGGAYIADTRATKISNKKLEGVDHWELSDYGIFKVPKELRKRLEFALYLMFKLFFMFP